jgi:hypothetical protein
MNITNNNTNDNMYNSVLRELQNYMFTEKVLLNSIQYTYNDTEVVKNINNTKNKSSNFNKINYNIENKNINKFFIPKENDSLFWCFYIIKYGEISYEMLENRNIITEKRIKFELIEKIRKQKEIIKNYKFCSILHIENQLANENKIDIKTFLSLCCIENINIFFINNKIYYELLMNDDNNIFIINCLEKNKYSYLSANKNVLNEYKNQLIQIDNIAKPLKCITSYKVDELIEIANKLGIDILNKVSNKIKTKKEIYELLTQYF